MFKHLLGAAAIGIAAFFIAPAAQAATFDFPTESATEVADGTGDGTTTGYYYFVGHMLSESFLGTGIAAITDISLTLDVNIFFLTETLGMGLSVNGTSVGSFDLTSADGGLNTFDFSGLSVAGAGVGGDDYTFSLFVETPVSGGAGSVFFGTDTIGGLVVNEAAVVPLPASLPLLLAGLAGFGALRRRKTT